MTMCLVNVCVSVYISFAICPVAFVRESSVKQAPTSAKHWNQIFNSQKSIALMNA